MSADVLDTTTMSAECALAARGAGYESLHVACRQTQDIPLPYSRGVLLMRRCTCLCHTLSSRSGR